MKRSYISWNSRVLIVSDFFRALHWSNLFIFATSHYSMTQNVWIGISLFSRNQLIDHIKNVSYHGWGLFWSLCQSQIPSVAKWHPCWHRAWVNPRLPQGTYISCVSDIRKRQGCHRWVNIDLALDSLNKCRVVYSGSPRCSSPLKWQEDTKRSFVSCWSSYVNAIENNTNNSQCWNIIDVYRCRSREMMNVSTFCYNQEEDYVLRPEWLQDMIWV